MINNRERISAKTYLSLKSTFEIDLSLTYFVWGWYYYSLKILALRNQNWLNDQFNG